MALVAGLRPLIPTKPKPRCHLRRGPRRNLVAATTYSVHTWSSLQQSLNCNGKFYCLFSDNRKQEQARKALESALGEKKMEFEKWDKEIKRREETGGGGNSGGGGWFRWFGGSDGDHFWQEAQQGSLTILGILVVFLIVAKGDVMLAVVFNPLLFALRGTRTGFTFLTSKISNMIHPDGENIATTQEEMTRNVSAKERVLGKWGSN
ncbi:Sulfate adenylyltransferase subunit 2 [Dorcoceras hygrometricum]|uniref:Sulfate adenylyltransferase subunit 2 n=1 Tax=Dorcoceras hygrometricum TaxID=472368 RepID=A0A2Z7A3J1_9LAMI|nr:Sulfate adenylyltransferase subunit 2 [Dorcoceras hygrometricum]